ncbi:MAG TPA: SIS domain-containing protein [Dehalococcoidia bacterium]|nr:SIS domain-containing protein [Dehalococcoidia bacterium]
MDVNGDTVVKDYLQSLSQLCFTVSQQAIKEAVEIVYDVWRKGGTVFTMGNGGSASTAAHLASDLAKYAIVPGRRRLKAMSLGDNIPLVSAWTNDAGFSSIFAEQLEPWLREGDALVAISVHGGSGGSDAGPWSQNLLRAVALARERGAKVIGLSGFDGGALQEVADVCVVAPATSEPMGTPLVESFHVAIHHLICLALKLRIMQAPPDGNACEPPPRRVASGDSRLVGAGLEKEDGHV